MSSQKPREIAVTLLQRSARGEDYLENMLGEALEGRGMSGPDRALVQELTYGVTRWKATLDWLIAQKTQGRTQKPLLQTLLRVGLYQMFWLQRVPDHAAVHETVEMTKRFGLGPQAGFVNAVLRGYGRDRERTTPLLAQLKVEQPALGYSHPQWLVERWTSRWGKDSTQRLLEWNNTPPALFARVNTLRVDPPGLVDRWRSEGISARPRSWDWTGENLVWELESTPSLTSLPSFREGLFYVQDPSTLLAVHMLDPQPGEEVLDVCAAPGGKTTYIAQRMLNQGRIRAEDLQPSRLDLVRENCARLGVTIAEPELAQSQNPIGSSGGFDRVLVDAPCSNTGVMRRRVELRWRIRPEEIERLHRTQLELLMSAADRVKPGGTLVYSTCSLEPEENVDLVKEFLNRCPGFRLERERTLLPFEQGVDGAYVARLAQTSAGFLTCGP